jgi:hypothetical protein
MIKSKATHEALLYMDSNDSKYQDSNGGVEFTFNKSYDNVSMIKLHQAILPMTHTHVDPSYGNHILEIEIAATTHTIILTDAMNIIVDGTDLGLLSSTIKTAIAAAVSPAADPEITIELDEDLGVVKFVSAVGTAFTIKHNTNTTYSRMKSLCEMLGFDQDVASVTDGATEVAKSTAWWSFQPHKYIDIMTGFDTNSCVTDPKNTRSTLLARVPIGPIHSIEEYGKDYFTEIHTDLASLDSLQIYFKYSSGAFPKFGHSEFQLSMRIYYSPEIA